MTFVYPRSLLRPTLTLHLLRLFPPWAICGLGLIHLYIRLATRGAQSWRCKGRIRFVFLALVFLVIRNVLRANIVRFYNLPPWQQGRLKGKGGFHPTRLSLPGKGKGLCRIG